MWLQDLILLYLLGLLGWRIFRLLKIPAASFLGALTVYVIFTAFRVELPEAPRFLMPATQLLLGGFVGSRVTRETLIRLKGIIYPALLIAVWAVGIMFLLGLILEKATFMDIFTATLSSSVGGLPEMTILAIATGADVGVVTVMQTARLIATLAAFPIILKAILRKRSSKAEEINNTGALSTAHPQEQQNIEPDHRAAPVKTVIGALHETIKTLLNLKPVNTNSIFKNLALMSVLVGGGMLFDRLGVPAGAMVGSMFGAAAFTTLIGEIKLPYNKIMGHIQVGVAIVVADNIDPNSLSVLMSREMAAPVIISLSVIFTSSILVALLIRKLTGWSLTASLLSSAPAGFVIMSLIALEFDEDPFNILMLHLCRVIVIKSLVPIIFMFIESPL